MTDVAITSGELLRDDVWRGVLLAFEDIPLAPAADPVGLGLHAREVAQEKFLDAGIETLPLGAIDAIFRHDQNRWEIRYRLRITGFIDAQPLHANAIAWAVVIVAGLFGAAALLLSFNLVQTTHEGGWTRDLADATVAAASASKTGARALVFLAVVGALIWFIPRGAPAKLLPN